MEKVLKNLRNDIFCRIRCSKIQGVGVVAIRDIPKGKNPFKQVSNTDRNIGIPNKYIDRLDPEVKKMVHDFFQKEDDDKWYIPTSGLNSIDISFYMNHNKKPNIRVVDGKSQFVNFSALRKIKKGEELTINYEK